ncbi:PAC2 family protein [Corynebacterium lubricantis]|uniref:PAC2 family protein n=1 Tax=Corynebacterium lubricantis TaxID=541095 RepID=UPI00035DFC35|nr:PAC2 family protein [Corynebacterium lubricantis]
MDEDSRQMYEMEYPAPAVETNEASGPTLVISMQGYADAGHAVECVANHLKAALDNKEVATFNTDELIDYRSRRPSVQMASGEITNLEELDLDMRVVRDSAGKSFLLLSGPEPDLRWEAFSRAVADLADKFNVSETICLYGAPMAVPHTRPLVVSGHSNDRDLLGKLFTIDTKWTVPGSAQMMIERELHKRGRKVAGLTAHVPHYLAQSPYPPATYQLLQSISDVVKLEFPLKSLEHDIQRVNQQLTEQTMGSEEIMHVVTQLEEYYDAELGKYRNEHPNAMMPGESQVPSGEEIGEAFENYLAALDDRDAPRGELPQANQLFDLGGFDITNGDQSEGPEEPEDKQKDSDDLTDDDE